MANVLQDHRDLNAVSGITGPRVVESGLVDALPERKIHRWVGWVRLRAGAKDWRADPLPGQALDSRRSFTRMNPERTSLGRSIAAHAVTVVMTLTLVMLLFGVRLGLRRQSPVVRIPGLSEEPPQALPAQVPGEPGRGVPPVAESGARATVPPEDVLKGVDPDEQDNIQV